MKSRKWAESEIPSSASVSVSLEEEHVPGYLGRLWSAQILWVGGLGGYVRMSQFPLVIVMQANVTYNYLLSWACSTTFQQFPKKMESPHSQDALQRHHFYSGWGKIFWCFSFQSPFVILFIIHYELENLKGKKNSKLISVLWHLSTKQDEIPNPVFTSHCSNICRAPPPCLWQGSAAELSRSYGPLLFVTWKWVSKQSRSASISDARSTGMQKCWESP